VFLPWFVQCFANRAGRTHAQSSPRGSGRPTECPYLARAHARWRLDETRIFNYDSANMCERAREIARSPRWAWCVNPYATQTEAGHSQGRSPVPNLVFFNYWARRAGVTARPHGGNLHATKRTLCLGWVGLYAARLPWGAYNYFTTPNVFK